VRVSVLNAQGKRLKGVRVKLTGAGIRAVVRKTNAVGKISFKVRPKKRGKLFVTATKAGYQPAYGTLKVR
jgi:hypothetical protein